MSTAQKEQRRPSNSELIGKRFHRLIAIQFTYHRGYPAYLCECDCGEHKVVVKSSLLAGDVKSCGCYRRDFGRERQLKHGRHGTPEWVVWRAMRQRCEDRACTAFKDYGARGITVCERWQTFEAFYADMGSKPSPNYTIERKDNNGNYEPGNCVWATSQVQARNRRSSRWVTIDGHTRTVAEWAEVSGVNRATITYRIRCGWPEAKLLEPAQIGRNRHD